MLFSKSHLELFSPKFLMELLTLFSETNGLLKWCVERTIYFLSSFRESVDDDFMLFILRHGNRATKRPPRLHVLFMPIILNKMTIMSWEKNVPFCVHLSLERPQTCKNECETPFVSLLFPEQNLWLLKMKWQRDSKREKPKIHFVLKNRSSSSNKGNCFHIECCSDCSRHWRGVWTVHSLVCLSKSREAGLELKTRSSKLQEHSLKETV